MKFESFGLSEPILRAVAAEGYSTPTPIQVQSIPHVLQGRDVLGCAQTGTGKTAAFALPILHRLGRAPQGCRHVRAMILAPTRELAAQIGENFRAYGRHTALRHAVIFGGVNQNPQVRSLRGGIDILIATPGRLLDLMNQGHVDLRHVHMLVLDEADRMLDMGFIRDIRKIVAKVPTQRQTLMFSATMPTDIRELAEAILRQPVRVQVAAVATPIETIEQSVYFVEKRNKSALLKTFFDSTAVGRALVFTRTKHGADRVARELTRAGIRAAAIHGNKSQNARTRAMSQFKSSAPPVLVATDIAARGIDVSKVSHVINYDLPNEPETYVHRIGRTGRAGASGQAVSFCDTQEITFLRDIERLIRKPISVSTHKFRLPSPDMRPTARKPHSQDSTGANPRERRRQAHAHANTEAQSTSAQDGRGPCQDVGERTRTAIAGVGYRSRGRLRRGRRAMQVIGK